tara:strand:+ start:2592 stop:2996 length:405 start_codon:yes stop_codon:yes gene_type:complete
MSFILKFLRKSKLFKFGIVGILASFINYSVFFTLLMLFDVNYLLSSAMGFLSGVFGGFPFNKKWTFANKEAMTKSLPVKYLLVYVTSLLSSLLILAFLVETLELLPQFANILILAYTAFCNFVGLKFFVFKYNR